MLNETNNITPHKEDIPSPTPTEFGKTEDTEEMAVLLVHRLPCTSIDCLNKIS